MLLLYLFLGALVIVIDASQICTEDDVHDCMKEMVTEFINHPKRRISCKTATKAEKCLKDIYDRCLNDFEKISAHEEMRDLARNVRRLCLRDGAKTTASEEDIKMVECVQDNEKLNSFLRECSSKALEKMYTGEIEMGSDLRDTQCATFLSIAHCVTKKVGEHCGKRAEKPFYFGMLQGLKSNDMSHSPECAAAIRDHPAEYAISDFLDEQNRISGPSNYKYQP